ncbi:MAG: hypothetical protein ACI4DY_07015 [Monoglobaceae bacterium]
MYTRKSNNKTHRFISNSAAILTVLIMLFTLTACEKSVKDKDMVIQSSVGELKGKYTGKIKDNEPIGIGTLCTYYDNGAISVKIDLNNNSVTNYIKHQLVNDEALKYCEISFSNGKPAKGTWFDQKGKVILTAETWSNLVPDLIDKDGKVLYTVVTDTTEFTKNNLWKFYGGLCEISHASPQNDGSILYDAYLIDFAYSIGYSGSKDFNEVTFSYWPDDDEPIYGMKDIVKWNGQLFSINGKGIDIRASKLELMKKNSY